MCAPLRFILFRIFCHSYFANLSVLCAFALNLLLLFNSCIFAVHPFPHFLPQLLCEPWRFLRLCVESPASFSICVSLRFILFRIFCHSYFANLGVLCAFALNLLLLFQFVYLCIESSAALNKSRIFTFHPHAFVLLF